MKLNFTPTDNQPKVAVLRCSGWEFNGLMQSGYVWLYIKLSDAGEKPRMFDMSGKEVFLKVDTVEIQTLRY